jgi:hypothetical protein
MQATTGPSNVGPANGSPARETCSLTTVTTHPFSG